MENEYNKFRVYIDGWKLPENSQLKLERVGQDDRAFIPEPDIQYRLKPADDNMYQEQVFLFLFFAFLGAYMLYKGACSIQDRIRKCV